MSSWYLYMVQTAAGTLYTGISTDPQRRLRQHSGELAGGAKALRGKGPLTLVYSQSLSDKSAAAKAEYQLKQLPRSAKLALVAQFSQSEI
ncbi:MAG: GIY-YIG nuclease family protein [Gammaproteobacteria bacterium]|nr:GIY-YIG nuclease family protein [Gammaproteobacteria bacterium]MBU1555909.1 GIY-YIG nuclease family protein [Gammaproteobacteria bacterium]MBU2068794.1 GIY-YIG nuclease family protein [Gammaproteobacteria bacterium]MBU2185232.1 GIY-YIG nuclease family protein [Gammaproteobacteria bacterium]MBU2206281.1 GIY-YIG nuclease family protein [Gammaproteobacteria bacterium]